MEEEKTLKIVCPFCNAPYTAKMQVDLFGGGGGCETCGYGSEPSGILEIFCDNCKKLVYKKEYE